MEHHHGTSCGRRLPPWAGKGHLRVATLALPMNRPDVRSACVRACVAYRMHVAARHAGVPISQIISQRIAGSSSLGGRAFASRSGCRFRHAPRSPLPFLRCLALALRYVRSGRGWSSSPLWSVKLLKLFSPSLARSPPRPPPPIRRAPSLIGSGFPLLMFVAFSETSTMELHQRSSLRAHGGTTGWRPEGRAFRPGLGWFRPKEAARSCIRSAQLRSNPNQTWLKQAHIGTKSGRHVRRSRLRMCGSHS